MTPGGVHLRTNMLASFHIAEGVARSPFGVQTRQSLASSRRLSMSWPGRWGDLRARPIFRELHDALMAVPATRFLPEHVANWSQESCQP